MKKKYILRNGIEFYVNESGYEKFWERFTNELWEKKTTLIFDKYIDDKTIYIDIGAWIGPTLFYAAQISKKSIAIEADPVAYDRLSENLRMNIKKEWYKKISILNNVVASNPGLISFGSKGSGGDSMSSLLWANRNTTWKVEAITPEKILSKFKLNSKKLFIKIDIEGGEFTMFNELQKLFSHKNSTIFLSLHNKYLKQFLIQKYKKNNYLLRWINIRKDFVSTYRKLINVLPKDKKITIDGRSLKINKIFYFYMFLFCKPFRERKFRDLLITPL
jgi:FkbM family methyltransferase